MNAPAASDHAFPFHGAALVARPSRALWWPERAMLVVSDLHLGKSERLARRGGALLPPYETAETLSRLADEIDALGPACVVCLGDSFDDLDAQAGLDPDAHARLSTMMAGRRWIWIEGNHDPAPTALPGAHLAELREGPLVLRHEAAPDARAEVSGHWHPKARLVLRGRAVSRPCFLLGPDRLILPAFGCYTGGLDLRAAPLRRLAPSGLALLCGRGITPTPFG